MNAFFVQHVRGHPYYPDLGTRHWIRMGWAAHWMVLNMWAFQARVSNRDP